ncbi:MAG: DDE-type integrase/transposase/recombinase [Hoeflea sp. D1-CHI-28]
MWRAVDHEGEILEVFVTKRRDRKAEMKFLKKLMKRYGQPEKIVTDNLRSYGAAMKDIGNADRQHTGRWLNNRIATHTCHSDEESAPCLLPAQAKYAEIRRRPFFNPQLVQFGAQPLQQTKFQAQPRRGSHRVAPTRRGIKDSFTVRAEMSSNPSDASRLRIPGY